MGIRRRGFLAASLAASAAGVAAAPAIATDDRLAQAAPGAALSGADGRRYESLSVYDFGAVGDGVTDDTAAIQRCLRFAARSHCRRVLVGSNHLITDLDLTRLYYGGVILEGINTTHQPAPDHANFIVHGSASQGLDISGTSGLVLRNLTFSGLPSDAPRCAVFASRIAGANESYGHSFENVRCYGRFTRAAIYNYAGEVWSFWQGDYRNDAGMATLYFTTYNSLGLVSKFRETDAHVRPLTVTSINNVTVYHTARGGAAIWFEQDPGTPPDATVQQIAIEHCYVVTRGNARATFRFSDIVGNVRIIACTDESYARGDADAAATCILIDGARTLRGLALEDNVFFPRASVIDARAPVQDYRALQNYVWNKPRIWRFARLANATHATLFGNEIFIVTDRADTVEVRPVDQVTGANNVRLPAGALNHGTALVWPLSPDGRLEPERSGQVVFDSAHQRFFVAVAAATTAAVSWREAGERMVADALPGNGNFASGQLIWRANPAPGMSIGWVCIENGSLGEIGVVHGTIEGGSSTLTVTDASPLAVGRYIRLEALPDAAQIVAIDGRELTLDRVASRGARGRVRLSPPRFAEWGTISA
jgi:hypothetical protein